MFGWGPFPVAPDVGTDFQRELIDPWAAWGVLLVVLVGCCGALWRLGALREAPDDDSTSTASSEIDREAA
jgi:hypothetical protein